MVEVGNISVNMTTPPTEEENIRSRIANSFAYFNEQDKEWHTITRISEPPGAKGTILIRYRNSRKILNQTIRLPHPFALTREVLYLWGLIAGSTCQERNFGICLDAPQEQIVVAFVKKLGLTVAISPVRPSRKRLGAERPPSYYRKVNITLPAVFQKFLKALGHHPKRLAIPQWFTLEQRQSWLEGYLNSAKVQCQIRHQDSITPKLIIHASISLVKDIQETLDALGVEYFRYESERCIQLIVQKCASIKLLAEKCSINRPKVRALVALLQRFEKKLSLKLSLRKFNLTEFQLTLYGVALAANSRSQKELEYTEFERLFACSSNEIRQNLYLFDKLGLIQYYEKENHKEYFKLSARYLSYIEDLIKAEEFQLKARLKYTTSNALSFHCTSCNQIVGYAEAIGDRSFQCPHCQSKALQPIELSKYSYYGHLGVVTHHQRLLQEVVT